MSSKMATLVFKAGLETRGPLIYGVMKIFNRDLFRFLDKGLLERIQEWGRI